MENVERNFVGSLIDDEEIEDEVENPAVDDRTQKNRDAEEARKRREAEEKAKAEKELEEKRKLEETAKKEKADNKQAEALRQIDELKKAYPDIDIDKVLEDEDFKKHIDGRWVIGGKSLSEFYKDFNDLKERFSKKSSETAGNDKPSVKISQGGNTDVEIFTDEEFEKVRSTAGTMSPIEWAKVEKKYNNTLKAIQQRK